MRQKCFVLSWFHYIRSSMQLPNRLHEYRFNIECDLHRWRVLRNDRMQPVNPAFAHCILDSCLVNNGGCGSNAVCSHESTTFAVRCACRTGFVNTGNTTNMVCTGKNKSWKDRRRSMWTFLNYDHRFSCMSCEQWGLWNLCNLFAGSNYICISM